MKKEDVYKRQADMAVHCYAGNAARGMSLVALHNGGGVGISKSINGGFGMVLDGSERVDEILMAAIPWDTMIGVSRRSWGRCEHSIDVYKRQGYPYANGGGSTCGTGNACCDLWCADSLCECMGGDLCSCM